MGSGCSCLGSDPKIQAPKKTAIKPIETTNHLDSGADKKLAKNNTKITEQQLQITPLKMSKPKVDSMVDSYINNSRNDSFLQNKSTNRAMNSNATENNNAKDSIYISNSTNKNNNEEFSKNNKQKNPLYCSNENCTSKNSMDVIYSKKSDSEKSINNSVNKIGKSTIYEKNIDNYKNFKKQDNNHKNDLNIPIYNGSHNLIKISDKKKRKSVQNDSPEKNANSMVISNYPRESIDCLEVQVSAQSSVANASEKSNYNIKKTDSFRYDLYDPNHNKTFSHMKKKWKTKLVYNELSNLQKSDVLNCKEMLSNQNIKYYRNEKYSRNEKKVGRSNSLDCSTKSIKYVPNEKENYSMYSNTNKKSKKNNQDNYSVDKQLSPEYFARKLPRRMSWSKNNLPPINNDSKNLKLNNDQTQKKTNKYNKNNDQILNENKNKIYSNYRNTNYKQGLQGIIQKSTDMFSPVNFEKPSSLNSLKNKKILRINKKKIIDFNNLESPQSCIKKNKEISSVNGSLGSLQTNSLKNKILGEESMIQSNFNNENFCEESFSINGNSFKMSEKSISNCTGGVFESLYNSSVNLNAENSFINNSGCSNDNRFNNLSHTSEKHHRNKPKKVTVSPSPRVVKANFKRKTPKIKSNQKLKPITKNNSLKNTDDFSIQHSEKIFDKNEYNTTFYLRNVDIMNNQIKKRWEKNNNQP